MNEYPVLKHAPITEALIDIRIKLKENFEVNQFETLHPSISEQYPEKQVRHKWAGKFEVKKGGVNILPEGDKIDAYLFTSADKKQIFQARIDGFTFNRLKPYENWAVFRDEALRLWGFYKNLVSPEIMRVALRYINKIEIPFSSQNVRIDEYLTAAPIVPEKLPQDVNSFLTRVVIHDPEINAAAIISQSFEQIIDPKLLPIILDIDVFREKTEGISEEDAWKILDNLRNFKNKIFFESITPKAKELFQ